MPDGTATPIDDISPRELTTPVELLRIDPESWRNYEFSKLNLQSDLSSVLTGDVKPEDFKGGKIGLELASIFNQLRKQNVECKTAIACTQSSELLLQINPSVGTADRVDNIFAQPPEGIKRMEIHNHPPKKEADRDAILTYGFFSAADLVSFAYQKNDQIAEAVVFSEGTAILLKTEASRKKIQGMRDATGFGRWAWTHLGNMLSEKMIRETPNDSYEERLNFSKAFAQEHGMKLLFVPAGQQDIQVLV